MRPNLSAFGSENTQGVCCDGIGWGRVCVFDNGFEVGKDFAVIQDRSVLVIQDVEPVYYQLQSRPWQVAKVLTELAFPDDNDMPTIRVNLHPAPFLPLADDSQWSLTSVGTRQDPNSLSY